MFTFSIFFLFSFSFGFKFGKAQERVLNAMPRTETLDVNLHGQLKASHARRLLEVELIGQAGTVPWMHCSLMLHAF